FAEGDNVIPVFLSDCGECRDCSSAKSNLCSRYPFNITPWMQDGTSRFTDLNGETLHHFLSVSSFMQYTVLNAANVAKYDPDTISPITACLLSCGVSTGVGAAWKTANVESGSTVVIFGLGAIGLAVAEGARIRGAARIIGVDINPEKFEISKKFGVTEFVNSTSCGDKSLSQIINEMTDGGADYCFECVGLASLITEAYDSCRKGWGKTVVVGVTQPGDKVELSALGIVDYGRILTGCIFGSIKPKSELSILIKSYAEKELELDKFITHEVGFDDINKA
ncbi:hypothetical protein M569_01082, partial [Genlisea aurea]